jgi:hypothetical protein
MMQGRRAGSDVHGEYCTDSENTSRATNTYESVITGLFIPYLNEDIPDPAWQTLEKKLCGIIRDMLAGRSLNPVQIRNRGRPRTAKQNFQEEK